MKTNDEKMMHEKKILLKALIKEEETLFRYTSDTFENIQAYENAVKEKSDSDEIEIDYKAVV